MASETELWESAVSREKEYESALIEVWTNLRELRPVDFKEPDGEAETRAERAYYAAENEITTGLCDSLTTQAMPRQPDIQKQFAAHVKASKACKRWAEKAVELEAAGKKREGKRALLAAESSQRRFSDFFTADFSDWRFGGRIAIGAG